LSEAMYASRTHPAYRRSGGDALRLVPRPALGRRVSVSVLSPRPATPGRVPPSPSLTGAFRLDLSARRRACPPGRRRATLWDGCGGLGGVTGAMARPEGGTKMSFSPPTLKDERWRSLLTSVRHGLCPGRGNLEVGYGPI